MKLKEVSKGNYFEGHNSKKYFDSLYQYFSPDFPFPLSKTSHSKTIISIHRKNLC